MATTGPKLNKEQRVLLREFAWDLRTREGATHYEIATAFHEKHKIEIDRSTVSRALSSSSKDARKKIEALAIQTIYEQSAQADMILSEALREFRRGYTVAIGEDETAERRDPAWLNAALKAMDHKAKIQGAYVDKIEFSDSTGVLASLADAQTRLAHLVAGHITGGTAPSVPSVADDA